MDNLLAVTRDFRVEHNNDITSKIVLTFDPGKLVAAHPMVRERNEAVNAMTRRFLDQMDKEGVQGIGSHVDISMETIDPQTRNPLLPDSQNVWRVEFDFPTENIPEATAMAHKYNTHLQYIARTGNMLQ